MKPFLEIRTAIGQAIKPKPLQQWKTIQYAVQSADENSTQYTENGTRWEARPLLGEEERRQMLAEIARVALTLGRDLFPDSPLHDLDIGDTSDALPTSACPLERLAFLRTVWPRFAAALHRLETQTPTGLRPAVRTIDIEHARRISPTSLLKALQKTGSVTLPVASASGVTAKRLPRRIEETVVVPTADTPPNRMVKAILVRFARDLQDIADLASVAGAQETLREALRLRHAMRQILHRAPWQSIAVSAAANVPPLPISARTQSEYAWVDAIWRQYRRGFAFDWSSPLFSLVSRERWLLYEYWCLFQVADTLRSLGFRTETAEGFALSRSGLRITLIHGHASRLIFRNAASQRVTLTYGREFHAAPDRDGWRSRSHRMRPDMTLEYFGNLFLLDAKYKAYAAEPILDEGHDAEPSTLPLVADINQMHAYRDGIRHEIHRSAQAAWLLYPGRREGTNRAVFAYPTATAERPFGEGEIGALLLRPGTANGTIENLRRLLHQLLGETM